MAVKKNPNSSLPFASISAGYNIYSIGLFYTEEVQFKKMFVTIWDDVAVLQVSYQVTILDDVFL